MRGIIYIIYSFLTREIIFSFFSLMVGGVFCNVRLKIGSSLSFKKKIIEEKYIKKEKTKS